MKKTLIALAVLAVSGAAMAQSSVTLYGTLDVNYGQTKTVNSAGVVTNKTTGLQDGANNGLSGSRWGLRGSEDLGNGLKANFNLEQRLHVNDGTLKGVQFNGRSVVGLSGGFGAVDLGREYTPIYSLANVAAVDGTGNKHRTNNLISLIERRDNAITYTSPAFAGVQAKLQLGTNEVETYNAAGVGTAWTKDRGLGLSVAYANGPLVVGAALDRTETNNAKKIEAFAVGGTYDLGVAKIYADYVNAKPNTQIPAVDKTTEMNAGVRVPFGAATLVAGLGRNQQDNVNGTDASGTDYMLGADYALSKRTMAYARVSQSDTYEEAKKKGLAVGLKHSF